MSAWNKQEGFSKEKMPELIPEGTVLISWVKRGRQRIPYRTACAEVLWHM